jgi:hypothetical protein
MLTDASNTTCVPVVRHSQATICGYVLGPWASTKEAMQAGGDTDYLATMENRTLCLGICPKEWKHVHKPHLKSSPAKSSLSSDGPKSATASN